MGVSGGGPYAAVTAYKIPKRLTRIGIVVGLGQIHGPESLVGVLWVGKIGWLTFGKYPWIRKVSAFLQFLNARYNIFLDLNKSLWGKEDRKLLTDPVLGDRLTDTIREAFHGGYKGPELDLKLYTTDWGFRLEDIRSRVYMWYGATDRNVSLNMGKYYAAHIRGSKLKIYQGEGHLISVTYAEEILKTLTS